MSPTSPARFAGCRKRAEMKRPSMGAEDFAYMLEKRPVCYFFLGTARTENDPPLHHPKFDFNDDNPAARNRVLGGTGGGLYLKSMDIKKAGRRSDRLFSPDGKIGRIREPDQE